MQAQFIQRSRRVWIGAFLVATLLAAVVALVAAFRHRSSGSSQLVTQACREPFEGRVHRLLRIDGEPTYFLLSKNGEILDHWVGSGSTISKIEAALK